MPDEVKGAITSDKVETDNTNFATVKADQTCEEALFPRENAFRQLNWQVTLEKGAIYNPQDAVGIYAEEVDCKYGVQIQGDVFGRNAVSIEGGGAAHSGETIGARVLGSLVSEGQVEVVEAASKMDDWDERPVTIYGDITGSHVTFEEPTVVYGCVKADQTLRTNAPTVVVGDVRSDGILEASDLFAFSITARDDITLGANVAVMNPHVRADEGDITIADRVGVLTPDIFEHIREGNDVDAVGPWIFDVDLVWDQNALVSEDVMAHGDGTVATRSWRTVNEPGEQYYAAVRESFEEMIAATRNDPPDIEEFRYAGVASLDDFGDITIEGDVVTGTQQKHVEQTDVTEVDQSETTVAVDQSTEVHDESTTIEDSVVNQVNKDVHDESTTVEESVVNRSDVTSGGDGGGTEGDGGDSGDEGLTAVAGVGEAKAEALREAGYGSIAALREADTEALSKVDGVGDAMAARIKTDVDNEGEGG